MEEGIVRRAVRTFCQEGIGGIGRKVRNRLSQKPTYRRLLVLELALTNDLPLIEPKIPVTFEELNESDFDELIALRPFLTEEVIRLRLETGHRFYVAKLDGRIVYTRAVAVERAYIGYLGIAFPLSLHEAYGYEAYTVPEYRGNRIQPACVSRVGRIMQRLGYRHLMGFVYPRNYSALRSLQKVGFERRGHIGFVESFGIRRYWYWVREGGFDCLNNAFFVPREKLVPPELEGQIW